MKPSLLRLGIGAFAAVSALPALAQDVQFQFTELGTLSPLSSLAIGGPGTSFSFSVAYSTPNSMPHDGVNVFLGFDRSNDSGFGVPLLDNHVGLVGTPSAAISNVNGIFASSATDAFGGDLLGGGLGARPYGLNVALQLSSLRTSSAEVRLFDVTLSNLDLAGGSTYDLTIYDAGDTGNVDGTSTVNSVSGIGRPGSSSSLRLTTQAVPEPASMLALASGAAIFLRRRSKRSSL